MQGGDHAGQQVGRAGPGIAEHGRHLARRLVQALGHVSGRRLVADRHQPDAVRLQLREQRVDLRRGKAEQELDALGLQRAGEQLAACDLGHGVTPVFSSRLWFRLDIGVIVRIRVCPQGGVSVPRVLPCRPALQPRSSDEPSGSACGGGRQLWRIGSVGGWCRGGRLPGLEVGGEVASVYLGPA